MRIISGKHRGKRIVAPNNIKARPTTDFGKESLFNILGNQYNFENVSVLDLFTGTGNISYEFCSRGARSVVSIDMSSKSVGFVQRTSSELGMPIQVLKSDVFRYIRTTGLTFDIVFADPPYQMDNIADIPKFVFEHNILNEGGMLIVEHDQNTNLQTAPHFEEVRKYGKVHFSFFPA